MESYHGLITTARDALILIEAARNGLIPMVEKRLTKRERTKFVRSGAIFVWEESINGIQRWTDGRSWTSSRVVGRFLAYNERDINHKVRLSLLKKDELIKLIYGLTLKDGSKFHLISYASLAYFRDLNHLPSGLPSLMRPTDDPNFQHSIFPQDVYDLSSLENIDQTLLFYNGELVADSLTNQLTNSHVTLVSKDDYDPLLGNQLPWKSTPEFITQTSNPELKTTVDLLHSPSNYLNEILRPVMRSVSYPVTELQSDPHILGTQNGYGEVYNDLNINSYVEFLQQPNQVPNIYNIPVYKPQPLAETCPPPAGYPPPSQINDKEALPNNTHLDHLFHPNYNEAGMFDPQRLQQQYPTQQLLPQQSLHPYMLQQYQQQQQQFQQPYLPYHYQQVPFQPPLPFQQQPIHDSHNEPHETQNQNELQGQQKTESPYQQEEDLQKSLQGPFTLQGQQPFRHL